MAEIAPAGGGPNRLFVVLAIGLAALLILGLIGLGGFLLIPRLLGLGAAPSPTRIAAATATRVLSSPTAIPTSTTAPTDTPAPTLVNPLSGGSQTLVASGAGTATPTVIGGGSGSPEATGTGTPGPGGQLPQSGLGEDLLLLAGGVVLVMVIFAARRARAA